MFGHGCQETDDGDPIGFNSSTVSHHFKDAPQTLKETLYLTNVKPVLEYACTAWDPFLRDKLERVQKRAARFVTSNYNFNVKSSQVINSLGWKSLHHRIKLIRSKFQHNVYNNRTGIDKDLYLKHPHYVSARRDNARKIREYQCQINMFKHSFFPNTISDPGINSPTKCF